MPTRLRIVTLNLPELYVDALDNIVEAGIYPSRSEAIRVAVRDSIHGNLDAIAGGQIPKLHAGDVVPSTSLPTDEEIAAYKETRFFKKIKKLGKTKYASRTMATISKDSNS